MLILYDLSMKKTKSRAKKKKASDEKDLIVIDESAGLIFENEEDLFSYFQQAIETLETEYQSLRSPDDFSDKEQIDLEEKLEAVLDQPDEIWQDNKTFKDISIHNYIKLIETENQSFYYIAIAYVSTEDQYPTFVLIHFPTKDQQLMQNFQRGDLIYDRNYELVQPGSIEGDALVEGDPLSVGLYLAMLKLRSDKDIPQGQFKDFGNLREETIENADEIWKKSDHNGNVLVCFIKEFPDHATKDLFYIAVTQEDPQSNVHSLLFSFPTIDRSLLDRYRQGENLQAEEIVQESSH